MISYASFAGRLKAQGSAHEWAESRAMAQGRGFGSASKHHDGQTKVLKSDIALLVEDKA